MEKINKLWIFKASRTLSNEKANLNIVRVKNIHSRIGWVDVGKGIGLLLVIFGHLVNYGSSISSWIFSFHIPLFFFLSGYISKLMKKGVKDSLKKILISLIVPYFIFVFIGLIVSLAIPAWRPSSLNLVLTDVFYNVDPESLHVGQIWFLFCLAIVEILFLFFLKLKIKNKFVVSACIGLSAIIAFVISKYNIGLLGIGSPLRLPWKIDSAFIGFFFFAFGYYSKVLGIFSKVISKFKFFNVVFMAIFFMINLYIGTTLNSHVNLAAITYGRFVYFIIASLSGIVSIVYISKFLEKNSFLLYIGCNTLSIFSLHSFLLYFYAFILSVILGRSIIIMDNIPLYLCFVGLIFVSSISLIIPFIYNNTFQRIILKLK